MRSVELRSDSGRAPLRSVRLQIGAGGLFLTLLRDVLEAFPHGLETVLQISPGLRASDLRRVIENWALDRGHRIRMVRSELASPFARDNAKAGRLAGESVLVVPHFFRRGGDREEDDLRKQFGDALHGKRLVRSRLSWDGGDLLSTPRHLIVAAAAIDDNVKRLDLAPSRVRDLFEAEFGQEALVLGDPRRRAPDPHLDLSVAVVESQARPVALVADPLAAARLAAGERNLRRRVAGQYLVPDEAVGAAIRSWLDSTRRRAPGLARYRRQLRAAGYEITLIPDLHVTDDENHLFGTPLSCYATNVVLDGPSRTAFSLSYGFPNVERAAAAAFRRAGWRLRFINRTLPAAQALERLGGGLHCMCGEWD